MAQKNKGDKMMIEIQELLNPAILNAGWVNFSGDSEYQKENGEYAYGCWNFIGILEDEPSISDFYLDDTIEESVLYAEEKWLFKIVNDKHQVCVVQFKY